MVKDSTPRDKKFDIILVLTLNMSLIMQVTHLPHTHVVNIKLIVCDSRITKSFLFVDKFYLGLFSFFSSFLVRHRGWSGVPKSGCCHRMETPWVLESLDGRPSLNARLGFMWEQKKIFCSSPTKVLTLFYTSVLIS